MKLRSALRSLLHRKEEGSMSVELVMLAPVMVLVILLLVAGGRIALASNAAEAAANAAAREASLSRTTAEAQQDANAAAQTSMAQSGYACNTLDVLIDDSGLNVPLGQVGTVSGTITCTLNLSDVALPGLPGTWTIERSATSPVDAYRERP
ncbi:TadE/TadG family type IV pilus assembly protein [Microbacterium sp. LB12]|uniref:TadE/TadG family type IV pilus assembly protein n=1 Tax=Microbacterium sp. LB12 TaxID=3081270 RepID=UPI003018069D